MSAAMMRLTTYVMVIMAALAAVACVSESVHSRETSDCARAHAVRDFVLRLESLVLHMDIPKTPFADDPIARREYVEKYSDGFMLGLLGVMTNQPHDSTIAAANGWKSGQRDGFVALARLCDEFGAGPLFY